MKIRGTTVATPMPRPDWNQTDPRKADYIRNKPNVVEAFVCTAHGEVIPVADSADYPLHGLTVYGKSIQNGTPTPDAPVPIVSAGADSGEIKVLLRDKLLIAEHPKDANVAMDATAVFKVKAAGEGLTYQWQYFSIYENAKWTNTTLDGCNTNTLSVQATVTRSGYKYRCVVTDIHGETLMSKPAFLTIGRTDAITILEQPQDALLSSDETAVFTVNAIDADGYSSTYQWQYQLEADTVWRNTSMTGGTTKELVVPASGNDNVRFGYKYRCCITDGNGITFTTRTVTLYDKDTFQDESFPEDAQVLAVPTPNGLPGLPVSSGGNYTDENGQMWLRNERDYARGVDIQRFETLVINSKSVTVAGKNTAGVVRFRCDVKPTAKSAADCVSMCSHISKNANTYSATDTRYSLNGSEMWAILEGYQTEAEIKAYLDEQEALGTPMTFVYSLAEPIETPIPAEEQAAYEALRTFKPNTTIVNDAGAGMEVEYVADTKAYIDNKFTELQNAILATGANV